jgi:hypothetical protein
MEGVDCFGDCDDVVPVVVGFGVLVSFDGLEALLVVGGLDRRRKREKEYGCWDELRGVCCCCCAGVPL